MILHFTFPLLCRFSERSFLCITFPRRIRYTISDIQSPGMLDAPKTPAIKLKTDPQFSATLPHPQKTSHHHVKFKASPRNPNAVAKSHLRRDNMKLITLNFLTCSVKTCKTNVASFPLHPRDAELEILEADINLPFLTNILPRLMWPELRTICGEVRKTKNFWAGQPISLARTQPGQKRRRGAKNWIRWIRQWLTVSYSSVSPLSPKPRQRLPTSSNHPALRSTQ